MASLNNTIAVNQMGLWWTAVAKRKLSLGVWVHSSFCKVYLDSFFLNIRYRRITSWIHKTLPMGQAQERWSATCPNSLSQGHANTHEAPASYLLLCAVCRPLFVQPAAGSLLCLFCLTRCSGNSKAVWHLLACFRSTEGFRFTSLVRIIYRFRSKTAECCLLIFFLLI